MSSHKIQFDDYAEKYDDLLKDQLNFFDGNIDYFAQYKAELVKRFAGQAPKTILDYGCGTGRSLRFLKEQFPQAQLFGCDISGKSLEIAAKQNPDVTFFLNHQPIDDQTFDLIVVACVLHHVPPAEREREFTALRKILNPGGEIFVFEHNPANPLTRHIVRHCPFDADAVLLKPQEVTGLFKKSNFEVDPPKFTIFFPGFMSKLRFLEKHLERCPLGGQYLVKATLTEVKRCEP